MKKIIKLTESDLTRIVKEVINEGHEYKPLNDFLTVKKKFTYVDNKNGIDFYILKYPEYHVIVGIKESYEMNMVIFTINVVFKRGEILNFIEYRYGKPGLKLSIDEERKMTRLINESIEFGELNKKRTTI